MIVPMDMSQERVQRLYKKNIELETGLRKSAQSKVPSDPNIWLQMRENYEAIILEDHDFSEKHGVEFSLWQLHYRRIEEFRGHINAAPAAAISNAGQGGKSPSKPDRIKKIRSIFKSFLSEATGFYHDLIQKIRAKHGLPLMYLSESPEAGINLAKDEKKSADVKKSLLSCHRCFIYLGDLARYKALYGDGDTINRDYAAASGYYMQASSLCPSSGNPHHQLAILAFYTGDELVAIYRYFRSLAVETPFSTARDNLIIAFEKNRQSYSQLPSGAKAPQVKAMPAQANSKGKGRGRGDIKVLTKDTDTGVCLSNGKDFRTSEISKAFRTRFVRLNGILFTRTSLETFDEVFTSVVGDLCELLSSGQEEQSYLSSDAAESGLLVVRLIAVLVFSVHNVVNRESEGQSYAEILQRSVLLQNAFTAAFEFTGNLIKRFIQLRDVSSSYLLPGILVFLEWLACHPDIASSNEVEGKRALATSFFWDQCVAFMNKVLLSGLVSIDGDHDESCFSNMSRYDEEETGNRLALWEDFELRGFLPLVPAQLILDFSGKHSFAGDVSTKEKKARMQRILAAGRALMHVAKVDNQGIYFDSKLKKFIIGVEPQCFEDDFQIVLDVSQSNGVRKDSKIENVVDSAKIQSVAQIYMENDDSEEEEVIVFKPTISEKHYVVPKSVHEIGPLQSYAGSNALNSHETVSTSSQMLPKNPFDLGPHVTMAPSSLVMQPVQQIIPSTSNWADWNQHGPFIIEELKKLNIAQNGYNTTAGLREGFGALQPDTHSFPYQQTTSSSSSGIPSGHKILSDAMVPSELDSVLLPGSNTDDALLAFSAPLSVKKNPVSRPVRHGGPPPGFSPVPSKQIGESLISKDMKRQNPLVDDYSWLDGYKPSAAKHTPMENLVSQAAEMYPTVAAGLNSNLAAALNFPFPGKQFPTVQSGKAYDEFHQDYQLLENLTHYGEQKLQLDQLKAPIQNEYQAQWPGRYLV